MASKLKEGKISLESFSKLCPTNEMSTPKKLNYKNYKFSISKCNLISLVTL